MSIFNDSAALFFSTLTSTHSWVKTHLGSLSTSSFISVRSEVQTQGHGQFKRKWVSPKGGIWASFCLNLHTTYQMNSLAMVLATSIISVLVARGVYPKLKWPNDLLLNEKKFAGVLVEICEREENKVVICSFGINVNVDPVELSQVDQPVTSLGAATEEQWDLDTLYLEIEEQFQRDFIAFEKFGYAPFSYWAEEWQIKS